MVNYSIVFLYQYLGSSVRRTHPHRFSVGVSTLNRSLKRKRPRVGAPGSIDTYVNDTDLLIG